MSQPEYQGWVDLERMIAEVEGVEYPITKLLDEQRRETTDPDSAVVCVCGRDREWMALQIHRTLDS